MEAEFRPFTYKEAGELRGFDVDLAREIGAALGVPVEFRERSFQLLASELIEGRGDLVISGVTATPERALECSFSDPYFLTRTIALLATPRADGVRKAADLDDPARTVVVQKGSTGENAARRHLPKARLVTFDTEVLCALEVAQGRADAFVYDEYQVRAHHAQHRDATRVLDETLSVEPYGIECRKGEPDTLDWLNLVVATMKRDGRIADLYRRHLPGVPVPPELSPP
jgi:polar amino acid transport system substrate-binding protein